MYTNMHIEVKLTLPTDPNASIDARRTLKAFEYVLWNKEMRRNDMFQKGYIVNTLARFRLFTLYFSHTLLANIHNINTYFLLCITVLESLLVSEINITS